MTMIKEEVPQELDKPWSDMRAFFQKRRAPVANCGLAKSMKEECAPSRSIPRDTLGEISKEVEEFEIGLWDGVWHRVGSKSEEECR